ncbi:MAG: c-type cytochrome domain-containing protein, partial [Pirellulales bacterium]
MKTTIYCAVIFFHGLSLFAVADQNTVGQIAAEQTTAAFLEKYCIQCHGDQKQKADRRFDTLSSEIKTLDDLGRYQEVVDQLNLESMPPEGKPQPSPDERLAMID